ncbi:MAG: hypothetical protein RLZ25_245 [Pseudomonadota bacterium]|jgi:hypothetical protein
MRFFISGEQNRQMVLNTIVLLFLVYMVVLWISLGLMYFQRMDLTPASVQDYYLGSAARFTEPRSYQSLLEVSHAHLFSMGMLAVTLTHLLLFAPLADRIKIFLSVAVYLGAIGDEGAGWLVRFVDPRFAYLKIAMFLLMEISLAVLIAIVIFGLIKQRRHHHSTRKFPARRKSASRGTHY